MSQSIIQVMLIETSKAEAQMLESRLRASSSIRFVFSPALTFEQALKRLREQHYDVLLLDLPRHPETGLQAVEKLSAADPNAALVVLGGPDDEELALEYLRAGAQDYLVKGSTEDWRMLRALRYAIERKQLFLQHEKVLAELHEAQTQVKQLSGLLPICASCKNVRDDQGYWRQIEEYIDRHSDVTFSHSICPRCMDLLYPEFKKGEGKPIRVVLVDDHRILREGLSGLLREEPDISIVGEADDGVEAVDLVRRLHPDVVVMDVSMPRMNGVEATRIVKREHPNVRVVALSMHDHDHMEQAMRDAGVSAFLPKGGPFGDLTAEIRAFLREEGARVSAPAASGDGAVSTG